jgi:hypothetical protein
VAYITTKSLATTAGDKSGYLSRIYHRTCRPCRREKKIKSSQVSSHAFQKNNKGCVTNLLESFRIEVRVI